MCNTEHWGLDPTKHSMREDVESPNTLVGQLGASNGTCSDIYAYEQDSGHSAYVLCLSLERWVWIQKQLKTYLSNTMAFKGSP